MENRMVKLWRSSGVVPQRTMAYLNRDSMRIDELTRQVAARSGALFVSPIQQLCDRRGCLLSVEPDRAVPVAWDSAHLSETGSKMLIAATLA